VTVADLFVLAAAGIAAGIVSTVAALASLVSYPVLLALGLPPLVANVTNTVSLCFTGIGAAAGSRPELAGQGGRLRRLGLVVALGGGTGAAILLLSPARTFEVVAPVLIGGASLVLLLQPSPGGAAPAAPASPGGPAGSPVGPPTAAGPVGPASRPGPADPHPPGPADPPGPATPAARARDRSKPRLATLFLVAVYVGYFGAAGGILLLAVLVPMLSQSLARTNAVKNVLTGVANGVAALGFAAFGPVRWEAVIPLGAGFLIGGLIGPALVRRIPGRLLQVLIALAGLGLAIRLGLTTYH
jgi:uncharacterized protein